jgi:hypothetical protein
MACCQWYNKRVKELKMLHPEEECDSLSLEQQ